MKALAKALEGEEGVWGEVASGHLTVGSLVASWGTLALEATNEQVYTGSSVLADAWGAAA